MTSPLTALPNTPAPEQTPTTDFLQLELARLRAENSELSRGRDVDRQEVLQLRLEADNLHQERDQNAAHALQLETKLISVRLSAASVKGDDTGCQYYTGLQWDIFLMTFTMLAPVIKKNKDSLPLMDQFFLALIRLRLNIPMKFMALQAGICTSTMFHYFWKWVDAAHVKRSFLVKWPDKEALIETLPLHFKQVYPRLTCLIDCFEIFVEQPSSLSDRAQLYSTYKKHTTVKVLVACSPLGQISYLSKVWGGRASNNEIVRSSGFISPHYHHPHDQILADRGFTLQDDFASQCSAQLLIPAFTKGKKQLSAQDVETTRELASIRIHVERIIGLLRNCYTILQGTLPLNMIKSLGDEADNIDLTSMDKILIVCAALCNLGESIVVRK